MMEKKIFELFVSKFYRVFLETLKLENHEPDIPLHGCIPDLFYSNLYHFLVLFIIKVLKNRNNMLKPACYREQ